MRQLTLVLFLSCFWRLMQLRVELRCCLDRWITVLFFLFSSKMIKREERRGAAPESGVAAGKLVINCGCVSLLWILPFFLKQHINMIFLKLKKKKLRVGLDFLIINLYHFCKIVYINLVSRLCFLTFGYEGIWEFCFCY